ncbi:MAG: signal peptidase II [Candidatus Pacearchaeota archaeon]
MIIKSQSRTNFKNFNLKLSLSFPLLLAFLFFIDRITKITLYGKSGCAFIFCITTVFNRGASLGFFSNFSFVRILIIILSFLVIFLISTFYYFEKNKGLKIAAIFVLAGILGNLFDRIFYGYVIDLVTLSNLFSFNLADCYIWVGVILFLFFIFKGTKID